MIVSSEESLDAALQMLDAEGSVRYSDEFAYVIVTEPETLESMCMRALARNSIAFVVPLGHEGEIRDHAQVLHAICKLRAKEEKKQVREWVRDHPEEVKRYMKESE